MTSKVKKVGGETTTYTYNSEDQLIGVTTPTQTIFYKYDAMGRRIEKNVAGTITRYIYDGEDIIQELDGNNQIVAAYTHGSGIDEPILLEKNGQKYYYISDGLGSITALVDSSGNVVQTYRFDSFGNIIDKTGSLEQPFTYTGREYDSETGLYYYRARYYNPKIGRFLQEDPIWDQNLYAYCFNNPLNYYDPFGLRYIFKGWYKDFNGFGATLYAIGQDDCTHELRIFEAARLALPGASGPNIIPKPNASPKDALDLFSKYYSRRMGSSVYMNRLEDSPKIYGQKIIDTNPTSEPGSRIIRILIKEDEYNRRVERR